MAPSKLRKAIGAVKDRTSISLAKVANNSSISDLDVAIVKATRHEEFPADERYIREILSLTCYSRTHISACVNTLSRRLSKTKNWTVALKTLMLIHRLLADGDPAYEEEIFFSTRRGTRLLNMGDFRDISRSDAWDYSAFVRTFAMYLDERLEYKMQGRRGKRSSFGRDSEGAGDAAQPSNKSTPVREMKTDHMFSKMQHLQQILDRFLACRPTGGAKNNRVVLVALYLVVKESFQIYYEIVELMAIFVDLFIELDIPENVRVYEMFSRISKQFEELDSFYAWSKGVGLARPSDYPEVEKVTQKRLDAMYELIRDKTALAEGNEERKKGKETAEDDESTSVQQKNLPVEAKEEEEADATKALVQSEDAISSENTEEKPDKEEEEAQKEDNKETIQQDADLLNLGDDCVTSEEHADKLALALFDGSGYPASSAPSPPAWEAFPSGSADWETALVQAANGLPNQCVALGGGFDMSLLDGMYQHGAIAQAGVNHEGSGSASSFALGSAGRPVMLALPAPNGSSTAPGGDPFCASLAVAPPSYVQISEMEKKQKLLIDEQLMWQQYAANGRQGQVGMSNPYNTGVYSRQY